MSQRTETLLVEAINTKPKFPKFNSGSILAGGKWFNIAKKVGIESFVRGNEIRVIIDTNDKGYDTVTGLADGVAATPQEKASARKEESPRALKTRDFDAEARGKVACVAYEAALLSPGLASLPIADVDTYLNRVEDVAKRMIQFVWTHQK